MFTSASQANSAFLALAVNACSCVGFTTVGAPTTLRELLDRALEKLGQKQRVAKLLGIKPPWFSRVYNGTAPSGSLGMEPCFKLADLLGESPQDVLRLAGKADMADALDRLYGTTRTGSALPVGDPIVLGLAEALASPKADRQSALWGVNIARKHAGLEVIEEKTARRRGPRR